MSLTRKIAGTGRRRRGCSGGDVPRRSGGDVCRLSSGSREQLRLRRWAAQAGQQFWSYEVEADPPLAAGSVVALGFPATLDLRIRSASRTSGAGGTLRRDPGSSRQFVGRAVSLPVCRCSPSWPPRRRRPRNCCWSPPTPAIPGRRPRLHRGRDDARAGAAAAGSDGDGVGATGGGLRRHLAVRERGLRRLPAPRRLAWRRITQNLARPSIWGDRSLLEEFAGRQVENQFCRRSCARRASSR